MKDSGNAMCLDVLDKALFVVCLDDANPETASEMCSNMLCEFCRVRRKAHFCFDDLLTIMFGLNRWDVQA